MYNVVIETAVPKTINEPKHNIKIVAGINKLKLPVARVCSDWLSAEDRSWTFTGSVDLNSNRIAGYLRSKFPDFTWQTLSSQKSFDIVSLDAGVAIEFKSVKSGAQKLIANASIYPDKVTAGDILTKRMIARDKLTEVDLAKELDVLVVAVERTTNYKVYNYAVVDGAYWGVTLEDYISCKAMYKNMNAPAFKEIVYNAYDERYPNDSFTTKLRTGMFGSGVKLNWRKLIMLSNPINNLNTAGYWGFSS